MLISILCVDKNFGIGKNNDLLFHLPLDMKFFRETTKGHTVAMGENTLLSFPKSSPLPNRINIVLSKEKTHNYIGCENIHDFNEFIHRITTLAKTEDVFVIGGASIYRQTLLFVDEVLLTKVDADGEATVFFPNLDEMPEWNCIEESEPIQDGEYKIRFCKYVRKQ